MRPENNNFGDFDWVKKSAIEPEGFAFHEGRGECSVKFFFGNVESKARLFFLYVFYVDVI